MITVYSKYDPTRTLTLRNRFAKAMKKLFYELGNAIYRNIYDKDIFGLRVYQFEELPEQAFAFRNTQTKIQQFREWLNKQIEKRVLKVESIKGAAELSEYWTNEYITEAYKRGINRAYIEARKAGFNVPEKQGFLDDVTAAINAPLHVDRLEGLYTRVFTELKGVTNDLDKNISIILTDGLSKGENPLDIAKKLRYVTTGKGETLDIVDSLGRFIPAARRAEMIARTEIIRAHHIAMVTEYESWKIFDVVVQAEFQTAEDDEVCSRCSQYNGKVMRLEEVYNLIPVHPNCRCIALPYNESIK